MIFIQVILGIYLSIADITVPTVIHGHTFLTSVMLIIFTGIAADLLFLFSFIMSIKKDYYVVIPEEGERISRKKVKHLLLQAKGISARKNVRNPEILFNTIIISLETTIKYYDKIQKNREDNILLNDLERSLIQVHEKRGKMYDSRALRSYKKSMLDHAQNEWNLAKIDFQLCLELNKLGSYSLEDCEQRILNIKGKLKKLELESILFETNKELKQLKTKRQSVKKDLTRAIEALNNIILAYSKAKEKAGHSDEFKDIKEKLEKNTQYYDVLLNFAFDASELTEREKYSNLLLSEENWPEEFSDYKSYVYRNLALIEREKGNTEAAEQILKEGIKIFKEEGQAESLKATLNLMGLIGKPAPEILAKKWLNSRAIKVNRLKGKVVIVDFWATWCSPCRAVIPNLVELYEEKKNEGLVILGYTRFYGQYRDDIQNLGKVEPKKELEKVKEFLERFKIKYPVAIAEDKTGFEKYFIKGIPTLVFIDKNGNIADFKIGSGNKGYVKSRVEELLYGTKRTSS